MRALKAREARFCTEYLVDLRGDLAAIRAGFTVRRAKQTACELLRRPPVAARIEQLMAEREQRSRVKRYRVLEELGAVAFSSIEHYAINDAGKVELAEGAPPDAMRAVASIKRKVRQIPQRDSAPIIEIDTELRLWSKPDTLRIASQHLGMLVEKHEHTGKDGGPIQHAAVEIYVPDNGRDRASEK